MQVLPRDRGFLSALIALALVVPAGALGAQERPGPLELAAGLRAQVAETGGPMYGVMPALVQLWREHPASELDVLADSMVAIAVDYHPRGDAQAVAVLGAVEGILMSAMRWEEPRGVPYAGASDRIVALAYRLEGRGGTIRTLTVIPDRTEALEHLRHFAVSDHSTAEQAVAILAEEAFGGAEGLAILRGLYDQGLVTEPRARRQLGAVAAARGWP